MSPATAGLAAALAAGVAAAALPVQLAAQEAIAFAAPGRAGGAPPPAAAPEAGGPMRVGFMAPPGAATAPPAMFRAFLERPGTAARSCLDSARRLVAAAGRGAGVRELTGPVVAVFGADATVAVIDPALRLGPAGLAGMARLPGPPAAFALDAVGQRLFVATAAPPAVTLVDLATRRAGATAALAAPAAAMAWDPDGEVLLVLDVEGALAAHAPETLRPRHAVALGAAGEALALLPGERLAFVAAGGAVHALDAASLLPLRAPDPLPDGEEPRRLAAIAETGTVFATSGRSVLAFEATTGRTLLRLALPAAGAATPVALAGGRAVAVPLADGSVAVADAANGTAFLAAPPGTGFAEAARAGETLYLRPEGSAQLALLDAARLRPAARAAPAAAEAGAEPFGSAALPLLAPLGGAMLVANPGDRRIYLHEGMGMAAPRAAFAAGGSPVLGLAAATRAPARTSAARAEFTAEAPPAGRWRLVFALPEQGRAVCEDIAVAAPRGSAP